MNYAEYTIMDESVEWREKNNAYKLSSWISSFYQQQ